MKRRLEWAAYALVTLLMVLFAICFFCIRGLFWTEAFLILLMVLIGFLLTDFLVFGLIFLGLSCIVIALFFADLSKAYIHMLLWEVMLAMLAGLFYRLSTRDNQLPNHLKEEEKQAQASYQVLKDKLDSLTIRNGQALLLEWSNYLQITQAFPHQTRRAVKRMSQYLKLTLSSHQEVFYLGEGRFLILSDDVTENLQEISRLLWQETFKQLTSSDFQEAVKLSDAHLWLNPADVKSLTDLSELLAKLEQS
ncbi:hypothetical protein [Streptococcus sp. DD12]|uniref:hypothetical protein n=1 Tax=Streptococcus sp. DD12 TaxID=1777880 RepID=UPI0007979F61|nr:hypothetical protein [Streptococcus sp. DD12]KXT76995.1 hypothetical protein STRDD12_00129 [Streptococcus sp. DD12]